MSQEEARAAGKETPAWKGKPPELLADGSHWGVVLPLPPSLAGATQSRAYLHCHQVSFVRTPTPSLGRGAWACRGAASSLRQNSVLSFPLQLRNSSKSYQGAILGSSLRDSSGQQQRRTATRKGCCVPAFFPLLLPPSQVKGTIG